MKLKKTLCCLIAAAMMIPFTVGCQGNNNDTKSSSSQTALSSVQQSPAESAVKSDDPSAQTPEQTSVQAPSQVSGQMSDQTSDQTSGESSVQSSGQTSGSDQKPVSSTITPALWKVEDSNGNYNYLFGTIHAADNSASVMPDYFEKAYADSSAIALEFDVALAINDSSKIAEVMKFIMYSDGTKLQDHISKEVYDGINIVAKNNTTLYYDGMYNMFTPVGVTVLMENSVIQKCGMDSNKGIDLTIANRAHADGKEVLEVESFEYQAEILGRLSDKVGELLLLNYSSVENYNKQVDLMKKLYDDWKCGRVIEETGDIPDDVEINEDTKKAIESYDDEMLGKRNPIMADKVESYLKDGKKVLVMVGAAHFYGDDGLLRLLEGRGYKITRLSPEAQ